MSSEVSTIIDRKDLVNKLNSVPCIEYYSFIMGEAAKEIEKLEAEHRALQARLDKFVNDVADDLRSRNKERDALQAKIKQLEAELEEERQENASLRSGDDYERGAD